MKFLEMFLLVIVLLVLAIPLALFGYDPLTLPPDDISGFLGWLASGAQNLKGSSSTLIIAFVLSAIIGIFKLTPLSTWFEKLGKWRFIIPISLGGIAELLINWPAPFAFGSLVTILVSGIVGPGALAIAVYHALKGFKEVK